MCSLVDEVLGDGALVPGRRHGSLDGGARPGRVVVGGGVVQKVDDAVEVRLVADGELDRGHPGTEGLSDVGQRAVEVGALAVQLVDHDHPGQAESGSGPPGILGLGLHAVGRADDDHRQVDVGEGGHHLSGEVRVPGRVQEVDPHPVDDEGCEGGRDGELPGYFLGLEVHHGGAFFD